MMELLESLRIFMLSDENLLAAATESTAYKIKPSAHSIAATRHAGKKYIQHDTRTNISKTSTVEYKDDVFTPAETDSLFWCFYIICFGFAEYELNRTNRFLTEKQCKLQALEKLPYFKADLMLQHIDISTVQTELIGAKPCISIAGLTALCFINHIALTYVSGRKYCQIKRPSLTVDKSVNVPVIIQDPRVNVHSLHYSDDTAAQIFQADLTANYLEVPGFSEISPKSISSLKINELRNMCTRLQISQHDAETGKAFTKARLCAEIVAHKDSCT
jgi:hypothetical protein